MPDAAAPDPLDGLVRCPRCRRAALVPAGAEHGCPDCGAAFPVEEGVLDLLPGVPSVPSIAQLAMESEPVVQIYESRLWRRSPLATLALGISADREQETILEAAALAGDESVLDLACGPGFYTCPLAARVSGGRVVGLDLSRPMLALASRRSRREGLANVGFVRGTALELPFVESRFDVVNCCGALHLFPDTVRALAEIRRVLRPDGRFTVATVRRVEGPVAFVLERLGVRSFPAERFESLLAAAGFGAVRVHHARAGWMVVSARAA